MIIELRKRTKNLAQKFVKKTNDEKSLYKIEFKPKFYLLISVLTFNIVIEISLNNISLKLCHDLFYGTAIRILLIEKLNICQIKICINISELNVISSSTQLDGKGNGQLIL